MRPLLSLLLAASLVTLASAREGLREIIHPKADVPAFRVLLPADWTDSVDANGNLLLANDGRTANFSFSFVRSSDPTAALDQLAKAILTGAVVSPWDSREPAEISGHRGYKYGALVRHSNGVEVHAELVLVAVGDKHIASCALLLNPRVPRTDETLARLVQAAVAIIPTP